MRVLILFCEEGEGHASAARALASGLEEAGAEVEVRDAMAGGLGRLIPLLSRDAYHVQVRHLAWTYGAEYLLFTRFPPFRALGRRGLALFGGRPLLRMIRGLRPDLVVSTHPAVTNVLGFLRRSGRLRTPAAATVTDLGVHPLWAHPGVDLHLVMHESGVQAVEAVAGAGSAAVVAPLVGAEFQRAVRGKEARAARQEPPLVLVSGGAWGVGDLEGTVAAALTVEGVNVVCLSGHNELVRNRLERRFAGEARLTILPFTRRMPELLAAADVLVDSSVGVTCLEAMTVGCPVIACGVPGGHSRDNARALERLGLAEFVRELRLLPERLARCLREASTRQAVLPATPTAAEALLGVRPRLAPRRRRRQAVAAAVAAAGALVFAGWTFASPTPYPVVAHVLDLGGLSRVTTAAPELSVVVVAPQPKLVPLAQAFGRHGMRVTFAISSTPTPGQRHELAVMHDGLLPALVASGTSGVFHVRAQLLGLRRAFALAGRLYYVPPEDFTLADYLAARAAGGSPLAGTSILGPGSVIVVRADRGYGDEYVTALASSIAAHGVRSVPLAELLSVSRMRTTGAARTSASAPSAVASSPVTSPASSAAEAGHHSPASSGASATGTKVVRAKTIGAT